MKHYVLVESNTTGTGRAAVERLLAAGQRVTFLSRAPGKYPFLALPRRGLSVIETETNDAPSVTTAVAAIRAEQPVDALLTFSDYYVAIVAFVAQCLGFPYLDPTAAAICRHKDRTRAALAQAGLPVPAFRVVTSLDEAQAAAREVSYPCVVKPADESSSKGVLLVRSGDQLVAQVGEILGWGHNARGQRMTGRVLIESLLHGPEYSVETFTRALGRTEVLGVTTKHLSPPPLFVEVGHDFPTRSAAAPQLAQAAVTALAAVGFDFGPAHTEVRLTAAGPVVVEINPRLAGGMIPELVEKALGIDLIAALFAQLCGEPVDLAPKRRGFSSVRFLLAPRPGRLAAVEGVEAARRMPGITEVFVGKRVGEAVQPAEDATHRLGHVIASGPEAERVAAQAEAALSRLAVQVEPVPAAVVEAA